MNRSETRATHTHTHTHASTFVLNDLSSACERAVFGAVNIRGHERVCSYFRCSFGGNKLLINANLLFVRLSMCNGFLLLLVWGIDILQHFGC